MADLLEDPDGAPYPPEVQHLWTRLASVYTFDEAYEGITMLLVDALESVAKRCPYDCDQCRWDGDEDD